KRVVRQQRDRLVAALRGRRATATGRKGEARNHNQQNEPPHVVPPNGCTRSTVPSASDTDAVSPRKTLLTPRVVPAGKSSPANGYFRPCVVTARASPPAGKSVTIAPGSAS